MSFVVPGACTLPTAERPVRLAEFDELFATAARGIDLVDATHARIRLSGPPGLAATVRDLTARESECCSFFTFTIAEEPDRVVILDIEVPSAHADVLDALLRRAEATR